MHKKINIYDINTNGVKLFKLDQPIAVFGSMEHHNGLTIGWGSIGCLWSKDVINVYVKPTRYSFFYANEENYFTVMWFDEETRAKVNKVFGSMSGRDVNKEKLCNLTPISLDKGVGYLEASLIIVCKKIYQNELDKNKIFSDEVLNKPLYSDGLFHSEYIGEIISVYQKE